MNMPKKITVQTAARLMGKSTLFVREGMRREKLPIGNAEINDGSTKWNFFISPPLLAEYLGWSLEEVWDAVAEYQRSSNNP